MKTCITTLGVGHRFAEGVDRLEKQVSSLNIPFFGYRGYPKGSPTHEKAPFAFKLYCIQECIEKGFNAVIWLDSCVIIGYSRQEIFSVFKKPLALLTMLTPVRWTLYRVYTCLRKRGYFFVHNFHTAGEYCHDRALVTLGITREESFSIPSLVGTNFALNMDFEICRIFFKKLMMLSKDGVTFPGPSHNRKGYASKNPRVKGHRHEQTAMSVLAYQLGMNKWEKTPFLGFIHDRKFVKDAKSTAPEVDMSFH